jgi:hypothetical protein
MFSIRYVSDLRGWFIFQNDRMFYNLGFDNEWEALDDLAVMRPREAAELRRLMS